MSASYRQMLNSGRMPVWAKKIKEAAKLLEEITDEIYADIGDDGQFDNAADDGALAERLFIAKTLIESELPKPQQ